MVDLKTGVIAGVLSCVCNGSHAAFRRLRSSGLGLVRSESHVHPFVWNAYLQSGALVTTLVLVGTGVADLEPNWQGFLAGAILAVSFTFTLLAVDQIGVARAEPLWCGAATLSSWVLGKGVFAEGSHNWPLSLAALLLAIVAMGALARNATQPGRQPEPHREPLPLTFETTASKPLLTPSPTHNGASSPAKGVKYALAAGMVGGCQLVPMHFVPSAQQGLQFAVAFAIGAFAVMWLLLLVYISIKGMHSLEGGWQVQAALVPALAQGIVFELGNIASIVAMLSPLGLGVAQPMRESGLVVGIAWGALVFHEIKGAEVLTVTAAGVAIVVGIACLVVAK